MNDKYQQSNIIRRFCKEYNIEVQDKPILTSVSRSERIENNELLVDDSLYTSTDPIHFISIDRIRFISTDPIRFMYQYIRFVLYLDISGEFNPIIK
ncbi:unnamed protein product [Rotaria sordida]|uniref:Uncharacterized protein n=1 Tax=Rotaria sordida TaxID=392033 RepID=A0A819N3U0_9BILA|nr:unnamed protein product [Rotaria sordida]